jgi:hypothetical protein
MKNISRFGQVHNNYPNKIPKIISSNMYNLRPRPLRDLLLTAIAVSLPPDVLKYIALLAHCQPRHGYYLRPRVRV